MVDAPGRTLAEHIELCLVEELADINGDGRAKFRLNGEVYDVDLDVTEGPVELVRQSDGVRFEVDVHVTATEAHR